MTIGIHRRLLAALLAIPMGVAASEQRCGWLENPSPGNVWLIDADADWTISTQGIGFKDEASIDRMPRIDEKEHVRTNRNYGFSCVCLKVDTDPETAEILKVYEGRQLLLKRCLEDPRLSAKIPLRN